MPDCLLHRKCFLIFACLFILLIQKPIAQTCSGSLGDPIVNITFGSGSNFGPPLPAGTTSALQYQAATCPSDGNYSIVNYTAGCWPNDVVWHTATDHTGNSNGYYMLINASNQPSNFYIQTIDGLCAGTTYQFAAWLINMCSVTGILPNITFTIERVDGTVLATYNTNDIPIVNPVTWSQYGFYFTTPVGVSTVVLRMRNNSPGGVGNDLGLDDITFKPAGPAIVATIAGNAGNTISICEGDKSIFQLTASVENCYASAAYQWQLSNSNGNSWADIAGANSAAYTLPAKGVGTYLYRLLVAESININITTCRVASNIITMQVHAKPVTVVTNNGLSCSGDTIVLAATGGSIYKWTGPNNFTASTSTASINNATVANTGKYNITVTDTVGCATVDSTTVAVYATPVAMFEVAAPACEKNGIAFLDKSATYGQPLQQWLWNFGDGSAATVNNPLHVFASPAKYAVSLQVQNDKGCKSAPLIKEVTVSPLPVADFLLPGICLADPFATFISTSSISDGSQSQFLYSWNFGDANASGLNPNTSAQSTPKHSYSKVGVYRVGLTVTSKDGCIGDTIKNFTVNGSLPFAKFLLANGQGLCSNEAVMFTDQSTVNFGALTKVDIYWDYGNQPSIKITDSLPFSGKQYTHSYPNFSTPLNKIITIKYVANSGISCVDEAIQSLTIKASPVVQFATVNSVCENVMPFLLTQAGEINGIAGTGIYSGDGVSNEGLFAPLAAMRGSHIIRYTFTANNSCIAFAEQPVVVFAQPLINAGADRFILAGGAIILNATSLGDSLLYNWQPNIAIDNNQVLMPRVSPLQNTMYTLKASTTKGCVATDEVMVTVLKDIFIPTAFSPNGDGVNDTWRIPFLDSYEGATIQVFNRYGQVVYFAKGKAVLWDGKYKGQILPTGSYAWMLNAGNGKKIMHGMVTIVR